MPRLPKPTYGLGILPYIVWLVENVGLNTGWWSVHFQPWLEPLVWPIAPAFLAGLVIQDLYNKKSWIFENWKTWTRKFEVICVASQKALDEPERYEVWAKIKFLKNIKSGRVVLRVFSCTRLGRAPFEHVIEIEQLSRVLKGEERKIDIATVAIPKPGWQPFYDTWGSGIHRDHNKPGFAKNSQNLVVIELHGGLTQQHEKLFIASIENAAPYVQRDEQDIFELPTTSA